MQSDEIAPSNPLHPKRTGSAVESVVIDSEPALSYVDDSDAEWHDAVTTALLTPTRGCRFGSICVVERDTPVEIKGCIPEQQNGRRSTVGRWFIKRDAHDRLEDERGVYWLTVYGPVPQTPILAQRVVPAAVVGDLLEDSWYDNGREGVVGKLSWTTVIDETEVSRRV